MLSFIAKVHWKIAQLESSQVHLSYSILSDLQVAGDHNVDTVLTVGTSTACSSIVSSYIYAGEVCGFATLFSPTVHQLPPNYVSLMLVSSCLLHSKSNSGNFN